MLDIGDDKLKALAKFIEQEWLEYDSDTSVGQWNLDGQKKRQQKALLKKKQKFAVYKSLHPTPVEELTYILKERMITKQDQIEKYK